MFNLGLVFMLISFFLNVNSELVRIEIVNDKKTDLSYEICGLYRSYSLGKNFKSAYGLKYMSNYDLCQGLTTENDNLDYNAVFVTVKNLSCSTNNMLSSIQDDLAGLAILSTNGPFFLGPNFTEYTIPFIFVPSDKGDGIRQFISDNQSFNSYTISLKLGSAKFDWSIVVLLVSAVLIIIVESLWNFYKFKKDLIKKVSGTRVNTTPSSRVNGKIDQFFEKIKQKDYFVSVSFIIFFCIVLGGLSALAYFFYNTMVWILSVVFACVASNCWYNIGCDIMDKIKLLDCKVPTFDLPFLKFLNVEIRKLVWFGACLALSMVWLGFRNHYWAWILLDILLISLVYISLSYRVFSSYLMLIVFLILITIYDIIMILILPKNNEKINQMTSIAFGIHTSFESFHENSNNYNIVNFGRSHSTNYMPFFLTIPNISPEKRLCNSLYTYPYTFLGIGDIILPGFSLNYAIIYDRCKKTKIPLYFIFNLIACCIGYFFVGLIVSFVDEILPAMLIVSPLMILSSLIIAFIKKEIKPFLMGSKIKQFVENYGKDSTANF
ncbi:unnamed protein product [Brachionus calyciflorus]|uniref:Uncharacterized protein n=1 Tax=Brachionus calyciflorus TaxID=104777 RepID=A0A813PDS9_9BILA|nr:unnamed protein product [Brachionus calyciflorus]